MKDALAGLFGLLGILFVIGLLSILIDFIVNYWPIIVLVLIVGAVIFIFILIKINDEDKASNARARRRANEVAERKKTEEEERTQLEREQELDKKISSTNDLFNTNLERDYQKEFITYWVGTTLSKFPINKLTGEIYEDVYNEMSAKLLADYSTAIFQAIYQEWYKEFHPKLSFEEIKDNAKAYAGGTFEKLSILELYTSYIAREMLDLMKIHNDLQSEMNDSLQLMFNDVNRNDKHNYHDKYRERKLLRTKYEHILYIKIIFLLTSVFYLDREGISIKGRVKSRKKKAGDIDSIVADIEVIKDEIIKNQDFYEYLQKSKRGSDDLINFVEIEISKLDAGDPEFLEKANAIIDAIDEELEG